MSKYNSLYQGWTRQSSRRKSPKSRENIRDTTAITVRSSQKPLCYQLKHPCKGFDAGLAIHKFAATVSMRHSLIQWVIFSWCPSFSVIPIISLSPLPQVAWDLMTGTQWWPQINYSLHTSGCGSLYPLSSTSSDIFDLFLFSLYT